MDIAVRPSFEAKVRKHTATHHHGDDDKDY